MVKCFQVMFLVSNMLLGVSSRENCTHGRIEHIFQKDVKLHVLKRRPATERGEVE